MLYLRLPVFSNFRASCGVMKGGVALFLRIAPCAARPASEKSCPLPAALREQVALRANAACEQHEDPSQRCAGLCKGNTKCMDICEQVRAR